MFQKLKRQTSAVGAAIVLSVGSAHAAVPTEITTAISDAKADAITVASAVLVAVIALFAIKFMRRGL